MGFSPRFCPFHPHSPSFQYRCRGSFSRKCDGRVVPRFECLSCGRVFSEQTFRVNYRLKRPELDLLVHRDFISKVTQRQSARTLGCRRPAIALRLRLFAVQCRAFHRQQLLQSPRAGGFGGNFQLDELESFEIDRRLAPLTVPVLIESSSMFVVHGLPADLPARKPLSKKYQEKLALREALYGVRKSGSREAVLRCFRKLRTLVVQEEFVRVDTDLKSSYATCLHELFGGRLAHMRFSSKLRRDKHNPLAPINFTFAMVRDGMSRLVRRNWATTKRKRALRHHLWVWIAWRNYVRYTTNRNKTVTPAMGFGAAKEMWSTAGMLKWRVFLGRTA